MNGFERRAEPAGALAVALLDEPRRAVGNLGPHLDERRQRRPLATPVQLRQHGAEVRPVVGSAVRRPAGTAGRSAGSASRSCG